MDELYAFFVFEDEMRQKFEAIHPSQFVFNTAAVGLSSNIGLLTQNVITLEYFVDDDPQSEYYEEMTS